MTGDYCHNLSQSVHVDLCKHLGIDSSTDRTPIIRIGTQSIPKWLHKSPCACQILKNDRILYYLWHTACFSI